MEVVQLSAPLFFDVREEEVDQAFLQHFSAEGDFVDGLRARVEGLGDLSHASAVFSRDGRYAFIFGRDGGLTKVDLLTAAIEKRIVQAGD